MEGNSFSVDYDGSTASRAASWEKDNNGFTFFANSYVEEFLSLLKEGTSVPNSIIGNYTLAAVNNKTKVVIYPIYSQAGNNNEVGYIIYTGNAPTSAKNLTRTPIIKNRSDFPNWLQPSWANATKKVTTTDKDNKTTTTTTTEEFRWTNFDPRPISNEINPLDATVNKNDQKFYFDAGFSATYRPITTTTYTLSGGADVWSKGKEIELNADQHVILYVRNIESGATFYSLKALNSDKASHSAIVDSKNSTDAKIIQFAGLEDMKDGDGDCNDVAFLVENANVYTTVEDTPLTYTVAFEDLGDTDDFDFNDVVVKFAGIQRVTNQTNGSGAQIGDTKTEYIISGIWLTAAGGTLPTNVYYQPSENESAIDLFGEVHTAFGVETSIMVNTGTGNSIAQKATDKIQTWPSVCKVSEEDGAPGFFIKVITTAGETRTIKLGEKGVAPQGFCIPCDWSWPTERTRITNAYSTFAAWASGDNTNNWFNNATTGLVMK